MIKLFISYSHADRAWCVDLAQNLKAWEPNLISWYDQRVLLGRRWRRTVTAELESADIVVMLVSTSFQASHHCMSEFHHAIDLQRRRPSVKIVSIWAEQCPFGPEFSEIQRYPPDRPLAKYPDRNDALTDVSNRIYEIATSLANQDNLPDMERDPTPFRDLLHLLCDRGPQHHAIYTHEPRAARPIVLVSHGWRDDAHHRFVERLEHRLLPKLLGGEKPARQPDFPLKWRPGRTPEQMFLSDIADLVGSPRWRTSAEVDGHLRTLGRAILLPATFHAKDWGTPGLLTRSRAPGEALIENYINLWRQWPQVPDGHALISTISIVYGSTERTNARIQRFLRDLGIADDPALSGLVLPVFQEIDYLEAGSWVDLPEVRALLGSVPAAREKLRVIFPSDETRIRMRPLADDHLPLWLRHCDTV